MASRHYLDFLGSVWDLLPEKDKDRLGETWEAYEQIAASVFQKYVEVDLNLSINDIQENTTERWIPYDFPIENFITRQASVVSSRDLSLGVNLSVKRRLKLSIDGGEPREIDIQGLNPISTTLDEIIKTINLSFGYALASGAFDNTVLKLTSPTVGLSSSIEVLPTANLILDASEFVLGVMTTDLPKVFPTFRYPYKLSVTTVASIPVLQDAVRDESITLSLLEGADYVTESGGVIVFSGRPPERLWARRTFVNEETPFNNFGYLMDIYQKNSSAYVQVLQGLWFAFWNGPRPINVRRSLYLLFGLPTAPSAATVTAASDSSVTIVTDAGETLSFSVPSGLEPLVKAGDRLEKFDPLTSGIDVFDKVNYPGFITEEVGRSGIDRFMLDGASRGTGDTDETRALRMLEEHTFLPQISVNAFINPSINLHNVRTFLNTISPKASTYLFQIILGAFKDLLDVKDRIDPQTNIDLSPTLDLNVTTWQKQTILDLYEIVENNAFDLDDEGVAPGDRLEIEVRSYGELIDSFGA